MTSEQEAAMMRVVEAAKAVVDRWDTPNWVNVPHTAVYIGKLRDALSTLTTAAEGGAIRWWALGGMMYELRNDGVYLIRDGVAIVKQSEPTGSREKMIAWMDDAGFGRIPPAPPARDAASDARVKELERDRDLWRKQAGALSEIMADLDVENATEIEKLERELADAKAGNDYKGWTKQRDRLNATIATQAAEIERAHEALESVENSFAEANAKLAAKGDGIPHPTSPEGMKRQADHDHLLFIENDMGKLSSQMNAVGNVAGAYALEYLRARINQWRYERFPKQAKHMEPDPHAALRDGAGREGE